MTDVTVTVQDGAVFALIDGQRFDDIELVSSVDEVLDRFEQSDTGEWYKSFTPGRATYVIWHAGNVIFQTHNTPVRRADGDSITWSWGPMPVPAIEPREDYHAQSTTGDL